jgi:hypothetical protein
MEQELLNSMNSTLWATKRDKRDLTDTGLQPLS